MTTQKQRASESSKLEMRSKQERSEKKVVCGVSAVVAMAACGETAIGGLSRLSTTMLSLPRRVRYMRDFERHSDRGKLGVGYVEA